MKPTTWPEAREHLASAMSAAEAPSSVREAPRRHVDERLIQCVWFDRLFRRERLQTASGKALEIVEPGRWNASAGPDFLGATIKLAGEERHGDIEIHVDSAEWSGHNHHLDPAYNGCVLHAFLWAGDDRPYDTLYDGKRLERFELGLVLETDLETLRKTVHVEEYPYGRPSALGLCHPQMIGLDEEFVSGVLDLAGRERLESKIRRLADQLPGEGYDQVFYQALMTSQGHKASKTLYFLLSKRVRLEELYDHTGERSESDRARAMGAILMAVAGLWNGEGPPAIAGEKLPDSGTVEYLQACRTAWAAAKPYFADRMIPPTRRWWQGIRPANFPTRRLAGVAHLLTRLAGRQGPMQTLLAQLRGLADCPPESPREIREAVSGLAARFVVDEPGDFWSRHFTLDGKPAPRPLALVGESAARSLAFNVALPMGLLWARREGDKRLEKALAAFVARFPPLPANEVTEFMEKRLFGNDPRARRLLRTEQRHQALFHFFTDCCNANEKTCAECLLATRGAGGALAAR